MIRPFGLNDVFLVRGLQRRASALAIEHKLTHPRDPLGMALTAPWPWAGTGVATYVLKEKVRGRSAVGFVQLMKRVNRPEADLLYVAPALLPGSRAQATEAIWERLLEHGSKEAACHGLLRVYVSIPDGGAEQACLKNAGFSLYTRETIHRLPAASLVEVSSANFRPQSAQDSWALERLYSRATPRLVQQAEGALTGEAGSPPLSWWDPARWHGIVWEQAAEVQGAVQVHFGRAGHWLRIWGTNLLGERDLRALVSQGLNLIAMNRPLRERNPLPVYATVRDYEAGLSAALRDVGFVAYTDRTRFVKHALATVRDPVPAALGALEVRPEVPAQSRAHIFPLAHRTTANAGMRRQEARG